VGEHEHDERGKLACRWAGGRPMTHRTGACNDGLTGAVVPLAAVQGKGLAKRPRQERAAPRRRCRRTKRAGTRKSEAAKGAWGLPVHHGLAQQIGGARGLGGGGGRGHGGGRAGGGLAVDGGRGEGGNETRRLDAKVMAGSDGPGRALRGARD